MNPGRKTSGSDAIEVAEDLPFQRSSWFWERIGQWGVAALVLAALAGLFGGGPLSVARTVSTSGDLSVEYPRFVRNQSDYELKLHVQPRAARDGKVLVWMNAELSDAITIERISPEPEAVELGRQRLLYHFRIGEGEDLAPIVFRGTTNAIGSEGGQVGLVDGDAVDLRFVVYP